MVRLAFAEALEQTGARDEARARAGDRAPAAARPRRADRGAGLAQPLPAHRAGQRAHPRARRRVARARRAGAGRRGARGGCRSPARPVSRRARAPARTRSPSGSGSRFRSIGPAGTARAACYVDGRQWGCRRGWWWPAAAVRRAVAAAAVARAPTVARAGLSWCGRCRRRAGRSAARNGGAGRGRFVGSGRQVAIAIWTSLTSAWSQSGVAAAVGAVRHRQHDHLGWQAVRHAGGRVSTTTDGATFETLAPSLPAGCTNAIGMVRLAVRGGGSRRHDCTSTDAVAWTAPTPPVTGAAVSVIWSDGQFVALGDGRDDPDLDERDGLTRAAARLRAAAVRQPRFVGNAVRRLWHRPDDDVGST